MGPMGPKGDTGPAGPLLTTLPSGATVYGIAGVDVQGSVAGTGEISLPYPFTTEPNVAVVQYHGTDLHCTGTADAPTAPPGYLCFYVESQSAVSGPVLMYGYDGIPGNSTKRGAVIAAGFTGAGYVFGTWAATG